MVRSSHRPNLHAFAWILYCLLLRFGTVTSAEEDGGIQSIAERASAFPMCDGSLQCNRFRYSYQGHCGNIAKPSRGRWCRPDYDMDAVCCGDSPLDCCVLNAGGIMVTMLMMALLVSTVIFVSCACCPCCLYYNQLQRRKAQITASRYRYQHQPKLRSGYR